MTEGPSPITPQDDEAQIPALVQMYVAGEAGADERLCALLQPPVNGAVCSFLGADGVDSDDVAQESLMAVLNYLRRRGGFEGNLVTFAVTVARNRCRNILAWRKRRPQVEIEPLADWIASPERNPLDAYEGAQVTGALRSSLAALDQACRELLTALFLQGTSAEAMCETLGLTTVRAVYYRRENCLKSLQDILMRALGEDAP